jgi:hypothetical protein
MNVIMFILFIMANPLLNRLAQESSLARVNTSLGLPGPHPYLERAL